VFPCSQVLLQGKSTPLPVNIIHAKVQQYLSRDDFNGKTINEKTHATYIVKIKIFHLLGESY